MTLVYLMRHGETEWNAARRLQGQADISLSDAGRDQVRAQRAALEGLDLLAVASDLGRTMETAALLGFDGLLTDRRLREIHIGDWEGRPVDDLLADDTDAYYGWRFGRHTPPGGEHWEAFRRRTVDALVEHASGAEQQSRDLLVVCHGGVIRAILDGLLGLQPERFAAIEPAGFCTIRFGEEPELVSYNHQSAMVPDNESTL